MFYVQKQCSNLLEELPELTDDVDPHISWMSAALGDTPTFTHKLQETPSLHFQPAYFVSRKVTRRRQFLARRGERRHVQ